MCRMSEETARKTVSDVTNRDVSRAGNRLSQFGREIGHNGMRKRRHEPSVSEAPSGVVQMASSCWHLYRIVSNSACRDVDRIPGQHRYTFESDALLSKEMSP